MYIYIYVNIYVYIYTCAYIYIHVHIYKYRLLYNRQLTNTIRSLTSKIWRVIQRKITF